MTGWQDDRMTGWQTEDPRWIYDRFFSCCCFAFSAIYTFFRIIWGWAPVWVLASSCHFFSSATFSTAAYSFWWDSLQILSEVGTRVYFCVIRLPLLNTFFSDITYFWTIYGKHFDPFVLKASYLPFISLFSRRNLFLASDPCQKWMENSIFQKRFFCIFIQSNEHKNTCSSCFYF
jgi:hypothetical protein